MCWRPVADAVWEGHGLLGGCPSPGADFGLALDLTFCL